MRSGFGFLSALFLLSLIFICQQAGAVSLNLKLNTTEYINDLIFYPDGTHDYSKITGCLSITNPSMNDTISDLNIHLGNCTNSSVSHINELNPYTTVSITYDTTDIGTTVLPSVHEMIYPAALTQGIAQELTFRVEITNPGDTDISILDFEKEFPEELELVNCTFAAGNITKKGNDLHWGDFKVSPNSTESLQIVFKTKPCSDIVFSPSNFSFTVPSFAALRSISLTAVTKTLFAVEKQRVGDCGWNVGVYVEDASEFNYLLNRVEVYLSDTSLNKVKLIKEYKMNLSLKPGESWKKSFNYEYSGTPVFFAKVYYTIPYTISGNSMPISPTGHGDFVVNSIVLDKNRSLNPDHDRELNIITPVSPIIENNSNNNSVSNGSHYTYEKANAKANAQETSSQKNILREKIGKNSNLIIILFLLVVLWLAVWRFFPFLKRFLK